MKEVLLVDDDEIFNFISTKLLQVHGMANEVHSARDGREALQLLNTYYARSSSLPDVILLDLNMPIMDGFTFIEAFRKLNVPGKENVKVVIVTSSSAPADVARARDLGITRFLTKPISHSDLASIFDEDRQL